VPGTEERTISGLRVQIDRDLCVGFGDCVSEAPEGFRLDEEDIAVFVTDPASVEREKLLRACDVCPVDALMVWDRDGNQLVP
jgi:ferredoxin